MTAGEERSASNEERFRAANEQIRAARESLPLAGDPVPFLCECDDERCTEIVRVPLADYAGARERPDQFIVAPGHAGGER